VQPLATEIYDAFMRGESIGAIAKKNKMDKGQVRRIVNRVVEERGVGAEVMHKLQDEKAD
jgi:Mor family transcriptional regulator